MKIGSDRNQPLSLPLRFHAAATNKLAVLLRATACNDSRVLAVVEVSVRPSVASLSPIKTVQARITKSSLWAATKNLVYRDKISCPLVRGFPSNESDKQGYPS